MSDLKCLLERTLKKMKKLKVKDSSLLGTITPNNNIPVFLGILNSIWISTDADFKNEIEATYDPLLPLTDEAFIGKIILIFVGFYNIFLSPFIHILWE
jgi:hypothetical protein